MNLYVPQYGLPRAINGVNSFWEKGYGDPSPQVVIILGMSREFVEKKIRRLPTVCAIMEPLPSAKRGNC